MICTNKYGKYVIPKNHTRPVTNCLRKGIPFEPETIEFVRNNHNNLPIVTAGTYIGDFLPAFKNIRTVFAFEPVPENYKYAHINKILNDLNNVSLENLCLSDNNEDNRMVISNNNIPRGGASRIIDSPVNKSDKIITVKSIQLDDYLEGKNNRISIIQLDVEGHEDCVLKGAMKTIEACTPIIIVETRPKIDTYNKLVSLGYSYHTRRLHGNHILYVKNEHKLTF